MKNLIKLLKKIISYFVRTKKVKIDPQDKKLEAIALKNNSYLKSLKNNNCNYAKTKGFSFVK